MDLRARLGRIYNFPWLADAIAILGGVVFTIQSWVYAHTQSSVLDEGAYLVKGYLFAIGKYFPFQDYGPWSNHMPFSFLIPGYIQAIFGPGLRTGRYFAVFLGMMVVLGVWLLARRLGNRWWSVVAIWLVALNIPLIKIYSIMASQGLVASMLVWILVLTLGKNRQLWQLLLGTALAGILLLTRLNLSPVLPILVLYIFWEYGKKFGLWNLAAGVLVVVAGHAIFWPGILRMWAYWLPPELVPFLSAWARPEGAIPNWDPDTSLNDRIQSLFLGVRTHFFAVAGALVSWCLVPLKRNWRSAWRFRAFVFLSVLFIALMLMHLWATLGQNYCVYCLNVYMAFFWILGLMMVIVSVSAWRQLPRRVEKWMPAVIIMSVSAGIGYGLIPLWGNKLLTSRFVTRMLHVDVPRLKSFRIQPGRVELWSLFANKFDLTEQFVVDFAIDLSRVVSFSLLGLIAGWIILRYGAKLAKSYLKPLNWVDLSPGNGALLSFLTLGTLFSLVAGLAPYERDCGWDVIASYEAGGARLAEAVPDGSKVYWWGGLSAVPLLYIPNVEIYPAQLNDGYSYRLEGVPDDLERYGWWSGELAERWLNDADVILIEARQYGGYATSFAESVSFDEVSPTPPLVPCRNNSPIHIFIRK